MELLESAKTLAKDTTECTLPNFQKLLELRDRADGEESAQIGELIEAFIMRAPLEVVTQIMEVFRA